jgi:hypothetical protein
MTDVTTIVDTYLEMWNESDAARRSELIERAWAEDGRYVDPALEATGHAALSDMVAAVHERFPGHRFSRTGDVDTHHDQLRFGWQLSDGNGGVAVAGLDVGEVAEDGRLRRITGFFDPAA